MELKDLPKMIEGIEIKNPLGGGDRGFDKSDPARNVFMLKGSLAKEGFDMWRHCFSGVSRQTGMVRGFGIGFVAYNPELGGDQVVFAQEGEKPSYLTIRALIMGERGSSLSRYIPWNQVNIGEELDILVSAKDCFLSETRTMGQIEVSAAHRQENPQEHTDIGRFTWDLKINKEVAFNLGYTTSGPARGANMVDAYWHAEGMKACFEGTVTWNGEIYDVTPELSYGVADKVWGHELNSPWCFFASNHLTSKEEGELKNSAFAFGGGAVKIGPMTMDETLIGGIDREGEKYEFNFSKFWTLTRTSTQKKETKQKFRWVIHQETPMTRVALKIECDKADMVVNTYDRPDGKGTQSIWTGGNGQAQLLLYRKKITLRNKWQWELVDTVTAEDVRLQYGK